MNPFFAIENDLPGPRRAYAIFDQSEPMERKNAEEVLFALEAVDADFFDSELDEEHVASFWNSPPRSPSRLNVKRVNPYDRFPLFRLEFTLQANDSRLSLFERAEMEPLLWITLERSPSGVECDLFAGLLAPPVETAFKVTETITDTARKLNTAFGLHHVADADDEVLYSTIGTSHTADFLATYDVGQGAAGALLDAYRRPTLYYDLGAGVYRNANTSPQPLSFCWTNSPAIILSHWDSDHWAGANRDANALSKTWIAPRQSVGPIHTAFASRILGSGGQLLLWNQQSPKTAVNNSTGHEVTVFRCTGTGRNDGGLGLIVRKPNKPSADLHWLLLGDAAYQYLPIPIHGDVVAVLAPHHGANLPGTNGPPLRPLNIGMPRMLYSFGPGNRHGRTGVQHPVTATVNLNGASNWRHGTWNGQNFPGTSVAGADVLATAQHPASHLGGIIIEWGNPLQPNPHPPCINSGAARCTNSLPQV